MASYSEGGPISVENAEGGGEGPPAEQDGERAAHWTRLSLTEEDPLGENWCRASVEEVRLAADSLGLSEHCTIVPGWFQDDAPERMPSQVAVLRVDCDWYTPCQWVYRHFGPLLSSGAPVIIDDYDVWEGCRLATHEYLAANRLPWKIRSMPGMHGAWMINQKGPY